MTLMELTNNPDEGTGFTVDETARNIEKLLESSDGTTEKVDADEDTGDSIELHEDDADEVDSDEEQSDEDSEEVESDDEETEEETKDEAKEAEAKAAKDAETVFEIDGKPISRKEAELGYLRQSDYTKKTTELKQQMVRYQTQQRNEDQYRAAIGNDLEVFKKNIAAMVDPSAFEKPSDDLYDADPYEHGRRMMEYNRRQDAIRQLMQAEQLNKEQIAKREKEEHAINQANARDEFAQAYPEFADTQKAPALYTAMGEFMYDDLGFDIDEINGIADPRILKAVYRLFKAEQVSKQVAKVVPHFEKKPKMATPGVAKPSNKPRSDSSAKHLQKLQKSGSLNDAEAWALSILEGK